MYSQLIYVSLCQFEGSISYSINIGLADVQPFGNVHVIESVHFQTLTLRVGNEKTAKNQNPAVEESSVRYTVLSLGLLYNTCFK